MKKTVAIILLVFVMLLCAACSSQENNEAVAGVTTSESPTTSSTEIPTTEPTKDPYEGWTRVAGYVMYMPNWPYEEWDTQNQDNIACYTVYIQSSDSALFHEYVQSLTDYGFSVEQTESYSYTVINPEGKKMYMTDHENGQINISFYYR